MSKYLLLLLLAGCGTHLLDEGYYRVEVHYLDDDWPTDYTGTTQETTWFIDTYLDNHEQEKYNLLMIETNVDLPGWERDYEIRFGETKDLRCGRSTITIDVSPRKDHETFTAEGFTRVEFCNQDTLSTEVTIYGYKIPKPRLPNITDKHYPLN